MRSRIMIGLGLAGLGGCHLIDQTSFGGAPRLAAPAQMADAFASGGRLPLLTIGVDDGTSYAELLRQAIGAAEARDGGVRFRLEAVVPAQGGADAQAAALDTSRVAARAVLDEMGRDGIDPSRVVLSAETDPHAQRPEIQLFGT